jgi:hypothetical protein
LLRPAQGDRLPPAIHPGAVLRIARPLRRKPALHLAAPRQERGICVTGNLVCRQFQLFLTFKNAPL